MPAEPSKDELKTEIERRHFARAAQLAQSLGLEEEEVRHLRLRALWQMSAAYRNAPGTIRLAQDYGFTKQETKKLLTQILAERETELDSKSLDPCFDQGSGRYLSFEEWLDHLTKIWDKLSLS